MITDIDLYIWNTEKTNRETYDWVKEELIFCDLLGIEFGSADHNAILAQEGNNLDLPPVDLD